MRRLGRFRRNAPAAARRRPPAQDVCTATAAEADGRDVQPSATAPDGSLAIRKAERVDGNPRGRLFDALWLNRSRADRISRPDCG